MPFRQNPLRKKTQGLRLWGLEGGVEGWEEGGREGGGREGGREGEG